MRPPVDDIPAPPFPASLPWVNVAPLRMDKQRGRPVLVEFWDFCRPSSLRTLSYVKAWHERYAADGLRVVTVHSPGFAPGEDEPTVRAAVERLEIEHPVCIDLGFELWRAYDNEGWPARYLWDANGHLAEYHYGEGAYAETEREIQQLLGVDEKPLPALRPEDEPDVMLPAQTADQPGAYRGQYEAGGVWVVLDGEGEVVAGDRTIAVSEPGCYELVSHPHHTSGVLDLRIGPGVVCLGTCFTPGVAAPHGRDRPAAVPAPAGRSPGGAPRCRASRATR
jgi:hypothetical protein